MMALALIFQGWVEQTELFYGTYSNRSITPFRNETGSEDEFFYDMPKAYFYTMFSLYLFILVVISVRY